MFYIYSYHIFRFEFPYLCLFTHSQHCVSAYESLLYQHPTSKQTTNWSPRPLTSFYTYWHPDLPLWASVLSYRWNVLCSTLRRSALFLSLNLDIPSDCGKLIVSGLWLWRLACWQTRVSSWRTLTLIVMPTNSIFRTRTGKMEVRVNLMAPRIKHWSTNERPVTCAAAYISDIKHLFRIDESG